MRPKLKILLSPGHSEKTLGAVSHDIQEWCCNEYQVKCLKSTLIKQNCIVDIIRGDNLYTIGLASKGYDAFIITHLNAFNAHTNYVECCVDRRTMLPSSKQAAIASTCAVAMATALNLPLYNAHTELPGVCAKRLQVLSGAYKAGCPVAFLTEAFFLDCYSDKNIVYTLIEAAMMALGNSILKGITHE